MGPIINIETAAESFIATYLSVVAWSSTWLRAFDLSLREALGRVDLYWLGRVSRAGYGDAASDDDCRRGVAVGRYAGRRRGTGVTPAPARARARARWLTHGEVMEDVRSQRPHL
jgi:hypothetical protein